MGTILGTGDKIQPREIQDDRKYYGRSDSEASDDFKTKTRTTTDLCFLLFFTLFLIVLLFFLGFCIFNGDIYRIVNGYDNCGNVCGRKNVLRNGEKRDEECRGASKLTEPYHIVLVGNHSMERKCVSDCNNYEGYGRFFHRCFPLHTTKLLNTILANTEIENFFNEIAEDFNLIWPEFVYLCLISLAFSVLILLLFRFLVGVVVWVVLTGVVLVCLIGTVFSWIMWNKSKQSQAMIADNMVPEVNSRKTTTYLAFAITATLITIIVILVIAVMRKRIQLVVMLFKEAGKAMSAMPFLMLQPILTFLSLLGVISLWFYFSLWIESSGYLSDTMPYRYQKNSWMKFTRWYNLMAMLWMCQFVIGCQHLVIAGAICEWYFKRNKDAVRSPIFKSFYNLTRYHLGSVALGSFLIALVQFVRVILKAVETYLQSHRGKCVDCCLKCCQCCLCCFEKVLKYLTRNAYIEIAMYGYSFCRAGRQAFRLLVSNALRVTAINSVGDFVLFLGKVLVVVGTVLIGTKMLQNKEGLHHMWVPLTMAGLFGYFVAHCFMTVYEMAIDSIFLCFCEDCEMNDGQNKPYYMSRSLMEFVENSNKAIAEHDRRVRNAKVWQQTVPTISSDVEKRSV